MIPGTFDSVSARGECPEDDGLVRAAAEQAGAVGCEADGRDGRGVVVQRLDDVVVPGRKLPARWLRLMQQKRSQFVHFEDEECCFSAGTIS